ncbi:MAG: 23S rRNA (uracil(1939)-C(5))-methyltransferase RlmD [Bacilli bacterium]|nr:23S rRNA (uracil(1939)-C(5))-methyltransferase RlmD [Bacilli bacterium]
MKKITGKILTYDNEFNGILKDGKNIYSIPNVIYNETVEVDVEGKPLRAKVLEKSTNRITPPCEIYYQCGGCKLLHIKYEEQLKMKTELVRKLFADRFGKGNLVNSCLGMEKPCNYRNKNQVVFGNHPKEKLISGFYAENSHKIIPFKTCYVQDEISDKIVGKIKDILIKMHISAYDEDRKRGLIRHVMVKRSFKTKETMVVVVTAEENFPGRSNFVKAVIAQCKEVTTIVQNINTRSTSAVLGNKENILYGKGYIIDELCGKKFKISSKSFYQINPYQTEVLYNSAINNAGLKSTDTILDAYSGVGTIGLIASSKVRKVLSVEIEKSAVIDAQFNAKINNIKNVSFFNDDASNFIVNLANRKERMDAIIMDPPRSGSDERFLKAVLKLVPEKIIYISCNPNTQVNDLKLLMDKYEIKYIQPVDMFPHTAHVENIVILTRK